nr:hypothetical protein [Tanacetum cinerariifolium]
MEQPLLPLPPQLSPLGSNNSFPMLTHKMFCDHCERAEECFDGYDGASGGEVIGSGVDLGVIKSSLGEILSETMGEKGSDMVGLSGGPV